MLIVFNGPISALWIEGTSFGQGVVNMNKNDIDISLFISLQKYISLGTRGKIH